MLESVKSFKILISAALNQQRNVSNEICEFLSSELDLNAVVFYEYKNGKLEVLGKSSTVRGDIKLNHVYEISNPSVFNTDDNFVTDRNNEAGIFISGSEGTGYNVKFITSDKKVFVIHIIQNKPYSDNEHEYLWEVSQVISKLLQVEALGNTNKSFKKSDNLQLPLIKQLITVSKSLYNIDIPENEREKLQKLKVITDKLESQMFSDKEYLDIKNGSVKINNSNLDLTKYAPDVKSRLASEDIDLNIQYRNQLPENIFADQEKLDYIITNLSKFLGILSPASPVTLFISSENENKIKFIIRNDNEGIGAPLTELLRPNFTNYVQEFTNTDLNGYSLIVTNHYCKMMGGSFKINKLQSNSIGFEFYIEAEAVANVQTSFTRLPKPGKNNNKILLIEDDFATSRTMEQNLQQWGYTPVIVNTANQAFDQIKKEAYLAVILNIDLPNYNGLELLKEIKELPEAKGTPVIVFSVSTDDQQAYIMGSVDYFVKPIRYDFLVETLSSYKLKRDSVILCVDDDEPALNLVSNAIEQAGFRPLSFSESWKVMDEIKGKSIDLAIIDLDMPKVNGFELIKQIKSENEFKNLPIIIYTGKENYRDDLQQIDGLFENLLQKQKTNIENLRDSISSMINRYDSPPPVEEVISKPDGVKILLAEDYKHSQIIVTRLLKKNNFPEVVVVENGQMAVDMAKEQNFSLILMDMQMPVMNGFDATKTIRTLPGYKETPIIALTAFAMKGDREKCLEAGATDYIPKPIDSKEFIEKVKLYTHQS